MMLSSRRQGPGGQVTLAGYHQHCLQPTLYPRDCIEGNILGTGPRSELRFKQCDHEESGE